MSENLKKLYNTLQNDYGDNFTADYDTFVNDMRDEGKRTRLYQNLRNDYGDNFTRSFDEFSSDIGVSVSTKDEVPLYLQRPDEVAAPVTAFQGQEDPYLRGFIPNVKQGTKGLVEGSRVMAGTTANLFTGSSHDAVRAMEILDKHGADGYNPRRAYRKDLEDKYDAEMAEYEKQMKEWREKHPGVIDRAKSMLPLSGDMPKKPKNPFVSGQTIGETGIVGDRADMRAYRLVEEALKKGGGDPGKAKEYLSGKQGEKTWGDRAEERGTEELGKLKQPKGFAGWVGNLVPQMVPNALAIAASVHPTTRPLSRPLGALGMGMLSTASGGHAIADARQYAKDNDMDIPESDVVKAGLLATAIEVGTEMIPFSRYMSGAAKTVRRRLGKQVSEEILSNKKAVKEVNDLLNRAAKNIPGSLGKKTAVEWAKDLTAESLSEFAAESLDTLVPTLYANREDYPELSAIIANGFEGAKAGLFMGAFLGTGSRLANTYVQNQRRKEQGNVTFADTGKGVVEILGQRGDNFVVLNQNGEVTDIPKDAITDVATVDWAEFKEYADGLKKGEEVTAPETEEARAATNAILESIVNPGLKKGTNPMDQDTHVEARVDLERTRSALDEALKDAKFAFDDRVLTMPMEQQKAFVSDVIRDEALGEEQKQAIVNHIVSFHELRQLEQSRMEAIEADIARVGEANGEMVNETTGTLVSAFLKGSESETPVAITKGMRLKQDEGNPDAPYSIDVENSDEAIYYIDENGATQVATADSFEFYANETVEEATEKYRAYMIEQEEIAQAAIAESVTARLNAPVESPAAPAEETSPTGPGFGDTAVMEDGTSALVVEVHDDGTYTLELELPTGEITETTVPAEELGKFGFEVEEPAPVQPTGQPATEESSATGAPTDATGALSEEAALEREKEQFMASLPVFESGKNAGQIDQSQMTPGQNLRYFEYEVGKEKTAEMAAKQAAILKKKLDRERAKLDNDPFNIALNKDVNALQTEYEAYQMYADQARVEKTRRYMEETKGEPSVVDAQAKEQQLQAEKKEREAIEQAERESLHGVPDILTDTAEKARARGFRSVNGVRVDRQQPLQPVKYTTRERKFGNSATVNVKRAIVDADAMQPSHVNGQRNPFYFISETQPKERTDNASIEARDRIAANINPVEITGGVTAYTGAPIANARGEVIQGNNRTDAIKEMYKSRPESAEKYKAHLVETAGEYNMTPEEVAAMKKPMAVDIADVSDAEAIRLGQLSAADTESGGTQRVPAQQTAVALGTDIGRFSSMLYDGGTEETTMSDLLDVNGKRALDYLHQKGIINNTQYQSAFDERGNITPEAKRDLQDVSSFVLFDGANDNIKQMFAAIPDKAKRAVLQVLHRDAEVPAKDSIIRDLQKAIEAFYLLRQDQVFDNATNYQSLRIAVEGARRQARMFNTETEFPLEKYSTFALELAVLFKSDTQNALKNRLNGLYNDLQGIGGDIFNAPEKLSLKEAIKKHFNDIDYVPDEQANRPDVGEDGGERPGGRPRGTTEVERGERDPGTVQPADGRGRTEGDNRVESSGVKPIGEGVFGKIYDQFRGRAKDAINFLLKNKGGDLLGVFNRPDVGDIDLVWGSKDANNGLEHIIEKHIVKQNDFRDTDELADVLDDVIANGVSTRENKDKVVLEKDGYKVVIGKQVRDNKGNVIESKNWVITGFDTKRSEKEKTLPGKTLTTPLSNPEAGGVTLPPSSVSESKDNAEVSGKQESKPKFTGDVTAFAEYASVKEKDPLKEQWDSIKSEYPDAVILFESPGENYEILFDDVEAVKSIDGLDGVTLVDDRAYIKRPDYERALPSLVRNGKRVAIVTPVGEHKVTPEKRYTSTRENIEKLKEDKLREEAEASKKAEKTKLKQLEEERDQALKDFLDAFNDLNSDNLGIIDNTAEKQAKMLVAGTRLIGTYTKLGVYKFGEILKNIKAKGIQVTEDLLTALKSAYGAFVANNDIAELDDIKTVRAFKLEDLNEEAPRGQEAESVKPGSIPQVTAPAKSDRAYKAISELIENLEELPMFENRRSGKYGDAFMPFSVEKQGIGDNNIFNDPRAFTLITEQNYIQMGDLMTDPRIDWAVFPTYGIMIPINYEQNGMGIFQEFVREGKIVNVPGARDVLNFATGLWFPNLKSQGRQITKIQPDESKPTGRDAEAIAVEAEAIERASDAIRSESEDAGSDRQRAGEIKERADEQIEKVETLLKEIDNKLANLRLSDKNYSTEGIVADYPISVLVRGVIKRDATKFVKAVAEMTGLEHDTDKKGKPRILNVNIAPAGGNVTFILWSKTNPEFGVYVSIPYEPGYGDGGYDNYKVKGTHILWRVTTRDNKWTGVRNQWANTDVTAQELAETLINGLNDHFKSINLPAEAGAAPAYDGGSIAEFAGKVVERNEKRRKRQNKRPKSGESQGKDVPLQGSLFTFEQQEHGSNEDGGTDHSRTEPGREKLPETVQVGTGTPAENATRDREGKRRNVRKRRGEPGSRPGYDVNKSYTNEEIHEIVSSVTEVKDGKIEVTGEITDDIKTIASRYVSGGIAKEGRGILDEYYTDAKIVEVVGDLISKYFPKNKRLRVLEPSVGTGNFLQAIPQGKQDVVTFEINETTAKIAKIFHPNAEVNLRSFETEFIDDAGKKKPMPAPYDLVLGNPPYGEHRGVYRGLGEESGIAKYEDYFVKRGLDVLNEGGILAMVLPSGWMNRHKRESGYTIENAYRLPSGAFKGTGIGTDIVILRKQTGHEAADEHNWFEKHPGNVLGEVKERSNRFGRMEEYIEGDIDDALERIRQNEARQVAGKLDIEPTPDNLNDIANAIDETGSDEKAEKLVKATREPVKRTTRATIKKDKLKTTHSKGDNVVPASLQFPHEFTSGEVDAFRDTNYDGTLRNPGKHKAHASYHAGRWVHDFYYAEGNIYDKLEQLERDKGNITKEQYEKQRKMLEKVLPEKKTIENINISPNTEFVANLMISTPRVQEGKGSLKDIFLLFAAKLPSEAFGDSHYWEVRDYVNNYQVYGTDKNRNQLVRDRRKAAANDLFSKFLKEELDDRERSQVVNAFNREYNAIHRPDYSRVPLFCEINENFKGKPLKLTEVQLAGIGMLTVKGVGLLAHEVGFGKTLSGVIAMHEAMTRGFAEKPLIVVPNNSILEQWIETIREIIPESTINNLGNLGVKYDLTDFTVNPGEITIVTYAGFKALGFKPDTYDRLSGKFEYITDELKKHKSAREKEIEKAKRARTKGKMMRGATYNFEDFGFDFMTFDEVHNANHIVGKVKLDKKVASDFRSQNQRTSDLGIKTWLASQYLQEQNNGRNVVLLSATPFTNKPLEYYSILSLVANKTLERMGFFRIDQFFETFMEADNDLEIKADGRPVQKTNVRRFRNNGLFQQLLGEFIDIKGEEDNPDLQRPERFNKEYVVTQNELTAETMAVIQDLLTDNETVLQGITHARAAAFSPYASDFCPEKPKNHVEFVKNSPKIDATVRLVEQNRKDNPGAGQIIYSELGIEFFPMIRDYLVKESKFNPKEVAIITGATSATQRAKIQTDFNNGVIKVVIGSPAIKEGMNLQANTTDMYILSLPYNFTQLRQVEGRGWRQGNKWDNIRINYMLTDDSSDVFMLQRLQVKQGLYNEAMKDGAETVDVSDIDTGELKTALIKDPDVRAEIELMIEKERLETEKTRIQSDLAFVNRKYEQYNKQKEKVETERATLENVKNWAEKGGYWEMQLERYEKDFEKAERDLDAERQKLAEKGVKVDDIINQEQQAKTRIADIEARIEGLKDRHDELAEKYRKENQSKATDRENAVERYVQERAEENKTFYNLKQEAGNLVNEPGIIYREKPVAIQLNWEEKHGEAAAVRNEAITPDHAGYNPKIEVVETHVERMLTNHGKMTFMGDVLTGPAEITGSNDVAFLFKNLESAASENAFVVLQNRDGSYKVIYVSTGSIDGTVVDFKSFLGAVNPGEVTRVTLVHNHPSGNLEPSLGDMALWRNLNDVCESLGIENTEGVIINLDSGRYGTFTGKHGDMMKKEAVRGDVGARDVYQFDRQVLYTPSWKKVQMRSSKAIAEYLSKQKRGTNEKLHVIIIDKRLMVNKYFLMDETTTGEELLSTLLTEVPRHGVGAILASNTRLDPGAMKAIKAELEKASITLLDVLTIKQDQGIVDNYKSFVDEGLLFEPVAASRYGYAREGETMFRVTGEKGASKREVDQVSLKAIETVLEKAGIPVEYVTDEEAVKKYAEARKKATAPETVYSLSEKGYQQTAISSADGAKVLNNLEKLKERLLNSPTHEKTFIGEVADALGVDKSNQHKASKYATFEAKNGKIVTIRLSNHNATVSNFDNHGEKNGISIVVTPKDNLGITNDGNAHVVEYFYDAIKLRRAEGKPLAEIINSIQQALYSGEYKDTTGLAEVEEVNAGGALEIDEHIRFFTRPGHVVDGKRGKPIVYGWLEGGKVYLVKERVNPETPIHEYSHLWDIALEKNNPLLWRHGVELFKQTDLWSEVVNDPNYSYLKSDSQVASEVKARLTGKEGADVFARMQRDAKETGDMTLFAKATRLINDIKNWLKDAWYWLMDTMTPWKAEDISRVTIDDLVNMTIADMVKGKSLDGVEARDGLTDYPRFRVEEDPAGFEVEDKMDGVIERPRYVAGMSMAEFARQMVEYNEKTRNMVNFTLGIPKPPTLNSTMSAVDVAFVMDAFNSQKNGVLKEVNKEMAKISRWYTAFIDRARPLEKLLSLMAREGAKLTDETNAYYDFITSASQATSLINEYEKTRIEPLQETLRKVAKVLDTTKDGKKPTGEYRWNVVDEATGDVINNKPISIYDKISLYLQARDIVEADMLQGVAARGARGFENNVRDANGKGVTPDAYIAEFEAAIGKKLIDEVWERVRAVNRWALDLQYKHGMIDAETYHEYTSGKRKYYVPQRGWRERDLSDRQLYYVTDKDENPNNPFNAALIKARGRQTLAGDPLAYMQSIGESSVMAAMKNQTKQKFLQFAEENADFARAHDFFGFKQVYYVSTGKLNENGEMIYERTYERPPEWHFEDDKKIYKAIRGLQEQREQATLNYNTGKIKKAAYERLMTRLAQRERNAYNNLHVKHVDSEASRIAQLTAAERGQHNVVVLRDGKEFEIVFTKNYDGERVANVLNRNFGKPDHSDLHFMQQVSEGLRKGTRFMSAMMTQYNPTFAVTNFIRDWGVASIGHLQEFGVDYQLQFTRNTFHPQLQGAVWRYAFAEQFKTGKEFKDAEGNKYDRYLKEFFEDGAQTGWSFLKDIDQLRTDMKRAITPTAKDVVLHGRFGVTNAGGLRPLFGTLTEASELITRFATYVTSREQKNVDGSPKYSRVQSAMHSKEASVNFDRKGTQRFFGTLFSFFNATVQGSNKIFRMVRDPRVKKLMIATTSLLMAGGALQALMMPDPDDDDEREWTEWELMNNLCMGKVKIPLPQTLRAFWGFGVQAGLAYRGKKGVSEALLDGTKYFFGEIIPEQLIFWMNGIEIDERTEKLTYNPTMAVRGATPTTIQPVFDVWQNTNFMGGTSYRTEFTNATKGTQAERTLGKRNVSDGAQFVSDVLWVWGGGDTKDRSRLKKDDTSVVAGIFDINPSVIETITRGYAAGTGKFVLDMFTLGSQILDPEKSVDVSGMAIANVLWKQPREYSPLERKVWTLRDKTDFYKNQFNEIKKNNPERYRRITSFHASEHGDLLRYDPQAFYRHLERFGTDENKMFGLVQQSEQLQKRVEAGLIDGKAAELEVEVLLGKIKELQ